MRRSTLVLTVLLVLSVSINLAVAGIILGHRFQGGPFGGGRKPEVAELLAIDQVPQALRKELWGRIKNPADPEAPRGAALRESVREAQRASAQALRARPFDPEAAAHALTQLRERSRLAQERVHNAIIATLADAQSRGDLPPPPDRRTDSPRPKDDGQVDGPR